MQWSPDYDKIAYRKKDNQDNNISKDTSISLNELRFL